MTPLRAGREEQVVEIEGERVAIGYDPDGEVWCVRSSSVPGLVAEGDTLNGLIEDLPRLVRQARLP